LTDPGLSLESESESEKDFPPMHPVTRLGRVIQQLRSFGELHADELEALALDLEAAGAPQSATRLRIYRDVQRGEAQLVVEELVDIRMGMASGDAPPPEAADGPDPAVNSPRRARWLAEQAAEAERLKAPMTRRDLFNPAGPKSDDQ
jgi:hypothetical protein